jgi:zinc transporter
MRAGSRTIDSPSGPARPFSPLPGLPPGLLWAFGFDAAGRSAVIEPELASAFDAEAGGWAWLHFDLLDQRCQSWLSALSHLHETGRATLLSSGDHQHMRVAGDCLAGVFADTIRKLDGVSDDLGHWRFAISDRMVISAGRHTLQSVELVHQAIAGGATVRSPANLVEAILEQIAGECESKVQTLSDELDRVEDRALADAVHDDRRPLGHLRRHIVRLHRRIGSLLTMIHRLDHHAQVEPATSLHAAVARVTQRLVDLEHGLREAQERGRLLQEEVSNKLASEMNSYLQAISVLTALFLPPTLIVGIFGMNTKGLPLTDIDDGFIWVMLISILSSAGTYWLLKRAPKLFKGSGMIR